MWHIAECIVRWLAPILSFTAEEMWRHLRGERAESVFLTTWHELPALPAANIDWNALIALRAAAARELERLRMAEEIGSPLDAVLEVWCSPVRHRVLSALGDELRFFTITSQAIVHGAGDAAPADAVAAAGFEDGVWLRVSVSPDPKCVRCWQHRPDVGVTSDHPELCGRCVGNLSLPGEQRQFS
jgi:isoleucyl-tRNA synthetase